MSDLEKLRRKIKSLQEKIRDLRAESADEEDYKRKVIRPLLEALGWNVSTKKRVHSEFKISDNLKKKIDFALKSNKGGNAPVIFIEVKTLDHFKFPSAFEKAEKQLFDYFNAYEHKDDIQLLVLTDVDDWFFYKPRHDRRHAKFKEVKFLVDTPEKISGTAKILRGFLSMSFVDSSKYVQNIDKAVTANNEYQKAKKAFPEFMRDMLNSPGPKLRDAIFGLHNKHSKFKLRKDEVQELMKDLALQLRPQSGTLAYSKQADISVVSKRRPKFKFSDVGIEDGAVVVFKNGKNTGEEATVVASKNKITYHGKEYSVSGLATILKERQQEVNGTLHWTYNGETLDALRKRKEKDLAEE